MEQRIIGNSMTRALITILSIIIVLSAGGQDLPGPVVASSYPAAQQHILLSSTEQFVSLFGQNTLDTDSLMSIARGITGQPFLLPYAEDIPDFSNTPGADLINTGRIAEAAALAKKLKGDRQIQLMLELANWYVHQPGADEKDLASANTYIRDAIQRTTDNKYQHWQYACSSIQGQYYDQKGDTAVGRRIFLDMAAASQQEGNKKISARAWQLLGESLPSGDTMRQVFFNRSLDLVETLGSKEKEIDLLWDLADYHRPFNSDLMEKELYRIEAIQESIGFRHTLFVKFLLAFTRLIHARYLDALNYAIAAFENMKWSGFTQLEAPFLTRIGASYEAVGKNEDALAFFENALRTRTHATRFFWYKSLIYKTELLVNIDRPKEALSLINSITREFPPITIWERIQVLSEIGSCYEKLNDAPSANKVFLSILELVEAYPRADPYCELTDTYFVIANFYITNRNLNSALRFQKLALSCQRTDWDMYKGKYDLQFKIDSTKGDYRSAMAAHILYKSYYDSLISMDQRKKLDELTIKYKAGKKDQDIQLLQQQDIVRQAEMNRNKLTRNIMIAAGASLLLIVGLLFSQFRMKQRANKEIDKKNKALQRLVDEKEWLLKEVHHRVKNNLHTVICLLESQAAYLENDALKAVENSQHRIYAISLIHQKLYLSDEIKSIDMAVYIPEFIRYLDDSFGANGQVRFHLAIDPLELGVAQAMPMGLIINEAVTNALKYAFPGQRKGLIQIILQKKAGRIELTIADNGIGIDPSLAKTPSDSSLGLKLIKGLTEDLNGDITIENIRGTRITILFDKTNERQP